MKFQSPGKWLLVGLAGLALILLSPAAFPQSCALCYTQAASSGSRMIEALRSGILVLIIPPTLMWLVIAAIMYSKRNQFKRADNSSGPETNW